MAKLRLDKRRREARNMTQGELSDILGVDRTTVTKWETGDALPRADMLPRVASALGCSMDDLLCP